MISKFLRISNPLYIFTPFYSLASTAKQTPSVVKNTPATVKEEKMLQYQYQKSAINYQLSNCFKEFQELTIKEGKQSQKITEIFLQALENMDIDTLTSESIKQILELLAKLQDEKNATLTIKQKLQEGLSHIKNEETENNLTIGLLIKLYASQQIIGKEIANVAQKIIKYLKSGQTDNLQVEYIVSYFVYLNSLHQPSPIQRQIRSELMKIVKNKLKSLSQTALVSFGVEINRISHHDFSNQQLQIAQQVFTKMEEKRKELDQKAIETIFNAEQCLSNKASLRNFHLNVLHSMNVNNRTEAHNIFTLIVISHKKLKMNDNGDTEDLFLKEFILKYILTNGKIKKYNNSIKIALEDLIPYYLTQQSIELLPTILIDISFKSSARLVYELKNKGIQIEQLVSLVDMSNLTFQQSILMLLTLSNSQKWSEICSKFKQTVIPYFQSSQQFFILFKTLEKVKATAFIQNFDQIFKNQIKQLFNGQRQMLNEQQKQIFFRYFFLSLHYQEKNLINFQNYVDQLPREMVDDFLEKQLNIKDNIHIGKIVFLLRILQKDWVSKSYVIALSRLLQQVQRKKLKKEENQEFWKIISINANPFQSQFKKRIVTLEYCTFLETLFSKYNSQYCEYYYTGQFFKVVQNFMKTIDNYNEFPRLQVHIIEACIYYNKLDGELVKLIGKINQDSLPVQEIQKIRFIKNSYYVPSISQIDQKTLPILLFCQKKDNGVLRWTRQNECIQVIRRSNVSSLYKYIVNMGCIVNSTNSNIYKCIMKEFIKKVNFSKVNLFPILRNIIGINFYLIDTCQQFLKNYLKYLTPRIDFYDYHIHILILNLLGTNNLSTELTSSYIKSLIQGLKHESQKVKQQIHKHIISTNYVFDDAQLEIFLTLKPHFKYPYFFYLEQHFKPKLKEKMLDNILKTIFTHPKINKYLTNYQYMYLKKKYPEQTNNLDLSELRFTKRIFTYQWKNDYRKLMKVVAIANVEVTQLNFYENILFKIRNTIVIFLDQKKKNAIYQFAFYQRLMKIEYGENINVSIILEFPSRYGQLQSSIRLNDIFTRSEWSLYFKNTSGKEKKYIRKSNRSENKMFKIKEKPTEKEKKDFMRPFRRT